MYFKLAWRNIWRNRARTFITMAAVFVAVAVSPCDISSGSVACLLGVFSSLTFGGNVIVPTFITFSTIENLTDCFSLVKHAIPLLR